jgi:hypothetical protein
MIYFRGSDRINENLSTVVAELFIEIHSNGVKFISMVTIHYERLNRSPPNE